VNYGWGVSGNAALNTVVMCPDLRKRSAGQGALTCCSVGCGCRRGARREQARDADALPGPAVTPVLAPVRDMPCAPDAPKSAVYPFRR